MLTAALSSIKKLFGGNVDIKEATKRPLEEESENELDGIIFDTNEPQRKKKCLYAHQPPSTPNNGASSGFSTLLMRFPWYTWKKEDNHQSSQAEMSVADQRQEERGRGGSDGVTTVKGKVKKNTCVRTNGRSLFSTFMSQPEDDVRVLEKKETRNVRERFSCPSPHAHGLNADFRFVPTSTPSTHHHDTTATTTTQKRWNSNSSRDSKSNKYQASKARYVKGYSGSILDRLLGKRKVAGFLSSRIKHSAVQKSFLHEEKMKYRQLLQQYTQHYTPGYSDSTFPQKISSTPSSSPVGMVTRSQWTAGHTKETQARMEKEATSPQPLPSLHHSVLEDVLGSKIMVGGAEGRLDERQLSDTRPIVPLVDISQEDNEEDTDSSDGSVVVVNEVPSPQAQMNSLEQQLKQYPIYDPDWVLSLRKKYKDIACDSEKAADATWKHLQQLEQRRSKKVSLDEKVTERLKLLDLTYPSKYTEIPDEDDEEEKALLPLTPEMEDEVDNALNRSLPTSETLVEKFHIQITRRDIKTLDGLNWLNDEVINFYMNLIMERSLKNDNYPSVYAFNTFFYPKLSKSGYQSVRRWTKKVDLFSYDLLLVPIHLGMHWCMSVVDFKMKCITYYDSMLGNNEWCLQVLLEYLEEEYQDKKHSTYNTSVWKLENKKKIPQQMNGSDCGMFACKFADYLSRRAAVTFDQEHMPYFRRRMVYEIINAKLL